jgi:hypothetical protein
MRKSGLTRADILSALVGRSFGLRLSHLSRRYNLESPRTSARLFRRLQHTYTDAKTSPDNNSINFQLIREQLLATSSLDCYENTVSTTDMYALEVLNEASEGIVNSPCMPIRSLSKVLSLDPNCKTAKALQAYFLAKCPTDDHWDSFVLAMTELEAFATQGNVVFSNMVLRTQLSWN